MDRSQIRYRPPDDPHLRVQRLIVIRGPVVVLTKGPAFVIDQDRAERRVPVVESGVGKFDTATQTL
jgi:hypothetical protein